MILSKTLENRKNDSKKSKPIQKVKITKEGCCNKAQLYFVKTTKFKIWKTCQSKYGCMEKIKNIDFDNICQVVQRTVLSKVATFGVHCFDAFKVTSLQCRWRSQNSPSPQTPTSMNRVITGRWNIQLTKEYITINIYRLAGQKWENDCI